MLSYIFFRQYFFTAIKLNAYCNKASREILLKLARLKTKNRLVCHNGSEIFLKNNLVYFCPFNPIPTGQGRNQPLYLVTWPILVGIKLMSYLSFKRCFSLKLFFFLRFIKLEETVTVNKNAFMNIRGCQIGNPSNQQYWTLVQYFQKLSLTKIPYIII